MADDIEDPTAEPIELSRFDLHGLWRVLLWGASAAMALAIVAGTAFSDIGTDRVKQVIAAVLEPLRSEPQQPQVNLQQIADLEKQTRTLAQTVRDLTSERDQFKGRLAILEQSLDDITGTIKRQTAKAATPQQLQLPPPQESPKVVAQTSPPVVSAPRTVVAAVSPTATAPAPEAPTTTASTVETAPAVTGPVPMPPTRIASIAPASAAPEQVPTTREIGVDVGGAASLEALRAHWAALKANIGPELTGLRPALTTRQKQSGATDYRLVLGPMPNSAAAIRLCTRLAASKIYCRAGAFNVQQFAERARPPQQLPPQPRDSIILQ